MSGVRTSQYEARFFNMIPLENTRFYTPLVTISVLIVI